MATKGFRGYVCKRNEQRKKMLRPDDGRTHLRKKIEMLLPHQKLAVLHKHWSKLNGVIQHLQGSTPKKFRWFTIPAGFIVERTL